MAYLDELKKFVVDIIREETGSDPISSSSDIYYPDGVLKTSAGYMLEPNYDPIKIIMPPSSGQARFYIMCGFPVKFDRVKPGERNGDVLWEENTRSHRLVIV